MTAHSTSPASASARAPSTPDEWEAYFAARWEWLRAPLGQPPGSERDEYEDTAVHRAVFGPEGDVLAIGRLHLVDAANARVRYVGCDPDHRCRGLGRAVMGALEEAAYRRNIRRIHLHAREDAVSFYIRLGYRATGAAPTLYGKIPQTMMEKKLTPPA